MKGLHIVKNKIAVVGFGVSGKSVTRYFLKNDILVDVFEDKREIDFDSKELVAFNSDTKFTIQFSDSIKTIDISQYDFLIVSPGVPMSHKLVQNAQSVGIECITDINAFLRIFRSEYPLGKVVSVTGSNGKSTTVSLLKDALLAAGTDAYLGGNIGTSPLDFFDEIITNKPVVILETSSYQLEYINEGDYFDIACVLNLSDNHLNRYGGKKELYALAKIKGIDSKHTQVVVNLDDEYTQKYILPHLPTKNVIGVQFEHLQNQESITLENNSLLYSNNNEKIIYVSDVSKMKLKGLHNIYNCAFVCAVLHYLGINTTNDIQEALYNFAGLIHRVQFVESINQVVYINDSKSTSPDATTKALQALGKIKNIVLISGGNDKDISYDSMLEVWNEYVKALILLPGSANEKLKILASRSDVELLGEIKTMQDAIDIAYNFAESGDMILLSPATDSHASFKSFEDRGNQFIQCIQNLKN